MPTYKLHSSLTTIDPDVTLPLMSPISGTFLTAFPLPSFHAHLQASQLSDNHRSRCHPSFTVTNLWNIFNSISTTLIPCPPTSFTALATIDPDVTLPLMSPISGTFLTAFPLPSFHAHLQASQLSCNHRSRCHPSFTVTNLWNIFNSISTTLIPCPPTSFTAL